MNPPKTNPAIVNETNTWLEYLQEQGRSARTIRTYGDALTNLSRSFEQAAITRIADIQAEHLQQWRRHLVGSGCSAATINLYVRVVQYWFSWQVKSDRLFFNPAVTLERSAAGQTLGRCPSAEQMKSLMDSVAGADVIAVRDRTLLELAYATGARCEELFRLDLDSIDLVRRSVVIKGKGGTERIAPLTGAAIAALTDYLASSRPVLLRGQPDQPAFFLGHRGARRLATHAIAGAVRRRGAVIGLKISPHDIRRAFATHLLQRGAGLAHLKGLLGHAGYSHLRAYLKSVPADMLAAVRNSPLNE